jgi:hypothetical protein
MSLLRKECYHKTHFKICLLGETCKVVVSAHRLYNYIETKAKCRQLKKLTCKGTLWQVFIKVYRLEILSFMLEI